jgi:hypothetical protein
MLRGLSLHFPSHPHPALPRAAQHTGAAGAFFPICPTEGAEAA